MRNNMVEEYRYPVELVYTAGPYSSAPTDNTEQTIGLAHKLMDLDFEPFVPHLYHYCEREGEHAQKRNYEEWLDLDLKWLKRADCLIRREGESPGSDREVDFCKEHDIPYFFGFDEFKKYLENIGTINVVCGPSGVGKTTLVNEVLDEMQSHRFEEVVSYTSRDPREYEEDGVDYHFVDDEQMEAYKNEDALLEHVSYRGNQYGFLQKDFENILEQEKNIVVVANVEGYKEIQKAYPTRKVNAFVCMPPSSDVHGEDRYEDRLEILKKRMKNRNDDEEMIEKRMENIDEEFAQLLKVSKKPGNIRRMIYDWDSCDYSVVKRMFKEFLYDKSLQSHKAKYTSIKNNR